MKWTHGRSATAGGLGEPVDVGPRCVAPHSRQSDIGGPVNELFAGVAGGLGLFIVGMWLLTESLKTLASGRLRRAATRWAGNRFSALLWGTLAGSITQSMSALTFIVVSILRSGLITTQGAFALILGGSVGITSLVVIVTFDIKVVALYVLGLSGAAVVSEQLSRFRPVAASLLGGAMIILGLVLLKEAAAPLAEQPWFKDMLEGTGNSLTLAFLVAALLTFIVQSTGAVSVFGISLATVGIISVDQAIMIMYGSCLGSGAIIYLLSANLTGRSRQVAMYMVWYDVLLCAVPVLLFYVELYFDIPPGEGISPLRRPGPGPATGSCLCLPRRVPAASHARQPGVVGPGARAFVANLPGRRTLATAVHPRPRLRGRRFLPRARLSRAETCGDESVPVFRRGAPGRERRAAARCVPEAALRHHRVRERSADVPPHAGRRGPQHHEESPEAPHLARGGPGGRCARP